MPADPVTQVVLDFDGTCTQIPAIYERYLELFLKGFNEAGFNVSAEEWLEAQEIVRAHSPEEGWMVAGSPAAPVAADPYIMANEAAQLILRQRRDTRPLPNINASAYAAAAAPWRDDALDTFSAIVTHGARIIIVSNSSSAFISGRLSLLLETRTDLQDKITVQSDAGKFRICELSWPDSGTISAQDAARFTALPVAYQGLLKRPLYLRRGAYFEAIRRALADDLSALSGTLFCGDIFEMDLAMPFALGARVHLLDRAEPFSTYDYERCALAACGSRGRNSTELHGLLEWFK
ncbi:hypothetical protein [Bradyrhizobium sp. Ai1a-2]|uniref:hypothetical protein n=1 Tax=Bradyrhizobium sp. Ai1a-2 TaxID=196490 RepID=UPI0003F52A7F|nr:hypothetical protein [Bradyrhizobium sp. Ai1a-2]